MRRSSNLPFGSIQQFAQFGQGSRATEIVALDICAAIPTHEVVLLDCFHAFGGGGHTERRSKLGNRLDDRSALTAFTHLTDEALVDLDPIEGKRPKVAERRIAGAKVIHRDPHPERPEHMQGLKR